MFAEKAFALIKEVDRDTDVLSPYNSELVSEVAKEVTQLIEQNQNDVQSTEDSRISGDTKYISIRVRHVAVQRNLRCLLAYHYKRLQCLRSMRWEFGGTLPQEIKANISQAESSWFAKYSDVLGRYMRSLGEDGGVNLAVDLKPPKALYIEVRCLIDFGRFELNDGSVLLLKKGGQHFLPRNECEELIRRGIFEHIIS